MAGELTYLCTGLALLVAGSVPPPTTQMWPSVDTALPRVKTEWAWYRTADSTTEVARALNSMAAHPELPELGFDWSSVKHEHRHRGK
jgi:hypothetical protein